MGKYVNLRALAMYLPAHNLRYSQADYRQGRCHPCCLPHRPGKGKVGDPAAHVCSDSGQHSASHDKKKSCRHKQVDGSLRQDQAPLLSPCHTDLFHHVKLHFPGQHPCDTDVEVIQKSGKDQHSGDDPKNQVIYVNSSQFASDTRYGKDSEAIVTACLHEGRHAYQHQVADGIVLHDNQAEADAWKENLSEGNYISFRENPRAYYNQPVEVDARRFAEEKYAEIVAERQSYDIEAYSDHAPRDVFERQLSDEGTDEAQKAASFQQTEKETNGISIA